MMKPQIALVGAECEENLSLRYIRGTLEKNKFSVRQIVFNDKYDSDAAAASLASSNATLAGFSMVFTYRAREFADLAILSRKKGYSGHICAGGHFAAFNAGQLLHDIPAIDSVIVGEGELPFLELAQNLEDLSKISGLVWRSGDGTIIRNPPAEKPDNLDMLALPSRKSPPDSFLGLPIANMLTSRGCTHSCNFCSISAWHKLCGGKRYRLRSTENVAEELSKLYHSGYRIFNFHDDIFFLPDRDETFRRMNSLRKELKKRKVGKIAFAVKSRPACVDPELFKFLKDMGMFRVFIGIEAGTDNSLSKLGRRNQTVSDNEKALEILNSLDLHATFNLLLLNPDSTLEDLNGNISFLRRFPDNPMNFCRTEVYSGTPLETELRRSGRLLGSHWGYGYKIKDPRAQLAFELMRKALHDRHFEMNNIHHTAMRLDFEHQLLMRFFKTTPGLRKSVKDFIREVNLGTCSLLEEISDAAEKGFKNEKEMEGFIDCLLRKSAADSDRLFVKSSAILAEIRSKASEYRNSSSLPTPAKLAASLGIVTGLAFGASCTKGDSTQVFEMIAHPPQDTGNNTNQTKPNEDTSVKPAQKEFPSASNEETDKLRNQFTNQFLRNLAGLLQPAADVQIELKITEVGKVASAEIFKGDTDLSKDALLTDKEKAQVTSLIARLGSNSSDERSKAVEELKAYGSKLVPELRNTLESTKDPEVKFRCKELMNTLGGVLATTKHDEIVKYLKSLSFEGVDSSKTFLIKYSSAEISRANVRTRFNTHICEMAPGPLD